ncbi:MAG: hypothetical protein VZR02_03835 [Lachnospiraceae bacterium]|nr:hypothetical protein [Lachnospiraceae bacterium]
MTNEAFLKRLELLTKKRDLKEQFMEIMFLIKQAYDDDLSIYVRCYIYESNPDLGQQAYIGEKNQRFLMCYTSKQHAGNEKRLSVVKPGQTMKTAKIRIRDVVNNMFGKESIMGLIINPDDEKASALVIKEAIRPLITGDFSKFQ